MKNSILCLAAVILFTSRGFAAATEEKPRFVRGDANSDERVDLGDAVAVLFHLFAGEPVRCRATADLNGDSAVNLVDPVYLLGYLFSDNAPPPAPFPACAESADLPILGCDDPVCPARVIQKCSIVEHGCVVEGVECPVFLTDQGSYFELRSGAAAEPPIGWCGSITAEPCEGCASFCMQGPIVVLCTADEDVPVECPLTLHGVSVRGVECVVFQTDDKQIYELVGGPEEVHEIGWSGTVTARLRRDLASFCMQGPIVAVCTAEPDRDPPFPAVIPR